MAYRYFELTENIPTEEDRELHAQFKHYLDHVVNVGYVPGTYGTHVIVSDRDNESITAIFGGPDEIFIHLYHIDEYMKF
ncbi:hypothetical protein N7922_13955 [Kosakonia sp. ML.JS2a]|uniref:hypothetical protein n=1 Tax=Kosakonia sp. ML.JS2a TaxID=2980557 RepID=UPI0021DA4352|nr:hypothetical protein [Kosakonia sp. ML.JS2a]UXY08996.1 hypothetical protein N7922_13955 [Kosakonia sp. ML.JS2a]